MFHLSEHFHHKSCNLHSHKAIVVTPPSLKSFANQKNLSNHRVVIRKNPLQTLSDHFRILRALYTTVPVCGHVAPAAQLALLQSLECNLNMYLPVMEFQDQGYKIKPSLSAY